MPTIASTLKTPDHESRTQRGVVRIWCLAGDVVLVEVQGHATMEIAEAIVRSLAKRFAQTKRPIKIFDDFSALSGYEAAARVRLTEWMRDNGDQVAEVHILAASKLASMAVAVANMALGGHIHSYSNPDSFETKFRAATTAPR
jgi:hypothetical protein